jgi:hypothetical protein
MSQFGPNSMQPLPFPPDAYATMQQWTATNNTVSNYYESGQRLLKNYATDIDDRTINNIRTQLSFQTILPLRKYLEISAAAPVQLLPPSAANLIHSTAAALGVPEEMTLVALLGAFVIAARGNFRIKLNDNWFEALTGYLLVGAHSGERKSSVIEFFRRVFDDEEQNLQQQFGRSGSQTEERVLWKVLKKMEHDLACSIVENGGEIDPETRTQFVQLEQLRKKIKQRKAPPRILVDTPTLEALAFELEMQNESLGIFEAEGGFWKHRLRSSRDDILLKAFTGEPFVPQTMAQGPAHLRSPVLAICTFVQQNVLDALYRNDELTEHGLTARFLPMFAPTKSRNLQNPRDVPPNLYNWYLRQIRALLRIERPAGADRTFHILGLSRDAKAQLDRFDRDIRQQIDSGLFEHYQAFGNKLAGHATRLAGAVHLMNHTAPHDHVIEADTMECGIALAEFFRQHAAAAFNPEARDGLVFAHKIWKWMLRERKEFFTERDALRGACSHSTIVQVRAGIDELERHNYLRRHIRSRGKSSVCIVHPSAFLPNFIF